MAAVETMVAVTADNVLDVHSVESRIMKNDIIQVVNLLSSIRSILLGCGHSKIL